MPGIRSMTGYAIAQGPCALGHVTVELRSVNSRFLDLQVRFPDELRPAEQAVRTLVTQSVARGKFEVRANLTAELTENGSFVSAEALTLIKKLQQSVVEVLPEARPMSVAEILAYPGVVKTEAVDNEALSKAVAGLVAEALKASGTPAHVISLDNFFKGAQYYPRLPDGTLDYENPDTLDMSLIRQCLKELSETGKTVLPVYDFSKEARSSETEEIDLKGGVCIVEVIHALNPELTSLVPGDQIYRVYAGLLEEYCIDGRRVINTQDIRLCRRTLRDAAARGRSPAKTLAMWDRVLDGETRYIKGFKTTADFLLDTSFTYELGLIAKLLRKVCQRFTLEGHNAELWDETARRFEHVAPVELDLLPADSMLREFYAGEL